MSKELREKAITFSSWSEEIQDVYYSREKLPISFIKLSDAEQILTSKLEEKDKEIAIIEKRLDNVLNDSNNNIRSANNQIQSLKSRVEEAENVMNYILDHLPDSGLSLSDKIYSFLNPQT